MAPTKIIKGFQCVDNMKNSYPSSGCFQRFWQWSKKSLSVQDLGHSPIHGLQIFQNAIEKDLREIHEGLGQAKSPSLFWDIDVLMARLNFLADVLVSFR